MNPWWYLLVVPIGAYVVVATVVFTISLWETVAEGVRRNRCMKDGHLPVKTDRALPYCPRCRVVQFNAQIEPPVEVNEDG